jgi:hypothetical protein
MPLSEIILSLLLGAYIGAGIITNVLFWREYGNPFKKHPDVPNNIVARLLVGVLLIIVTNFLWPFYIKFEIK